VPDAGDEDGVIGRSIAYDEPILAEADSMLTRVTANRHPDAGKLR
jgi:hypothetical protein